MDEGSRRKNTRATGRKGRNKGGWGRGGDGRIIRPELNWPRGECSWNREITILRLAPSFKEPSFRAIWRATASESPFIGWRILFHYRRHRLEHPDISTRATTPGLLSSCLFKNPDRHFQPPTTSRFAFESDWHACFENELRRESRSWRGRVMENGWLWWLVVNTVVFFF